MRATGAILARGRAHALGRMTSRVTIRRKGALTTQDEATGEESPAWVTIHADLPFRFGSFSQAFVAKARISRLAGEAQFEQAIRSGHLPWYVNDLRDGDYFEITAGENAGVVLRLVESVGQDQATAMRVSLLEATRPEEW